MSTSPTVAPELAGICEDATLLAPSSAPTAVPLAEQVEAHVARRRDRGGLVASLAVPDALLPALPDLLGAPGAGRPDDDGRKPLPVTVVVSGGAGGIAPAAQWAAGSSLLEVRCLATTLRDLDDLAGAALRTVTAAQRATEALPALSATRVSVEVPLEAVGRPGWLAALDEIAMADLVVAFRTGGPEVASSAEVVQAVDAALDRELPMRFTGGGHLAVTGAEGAPPGAPGYRNLLLAVRLVLDGDPAEEVSAALEVADADALDERLAAVGSEALVRARRWLTTVESWHC